MEILERKKFNNIFVTLSLSENAQSLLPFATSASILESKILISQHFIPSLKELMKKSFPIIFFVYTHMIPWILTQLKEQLRFLLWDLR